MSDLRILDRWLGRGDDEEVYDFCFSAAHKSLAQPGLAAATAALILQVINAWERDSRFPQPVVSAAYDAARDLQSLSEISDLFAGGANEGQDTEDRL